MSNIINTYDNKQKYNILIVQIINKYILSHKMNRGPKSNETKVNEQKWRLHVLQNSKL